MDRTDRISEEIKKEVSAIIQNELKDPRLPKMISVTAAEVTRDLRYAKIFISVLGDENDKKNAIKGLKSAAGFIRREIGQRLKLRYTPEILIELDNSIERGVYLNKLIEDTVRGKQENT
ncbi:MAG: 30S ribosome-binding factor RbfA [Clostridiaceae bacterium]|jgi:ribosome-binding factor A|nr:30S ribosome-binding factor RbfA [Clostridiaceae bacterium]